MAETFKPYGNFVAPPPEFYDTPPRPMPEKVDAIAAVEQFQRRISLGCGTPLGIGGAIGIAYGMTRGLMPTIIAVAIFAVVIILVLGPLLVRGRRRVAALRLLYRLGVVVTGTVTEAKKIEAGDSVIELLDVDFEGPLGKSFRARLQLSGIASGAVEGDPVPILCSPAAPHDIATFTKLGIMSGRIVGTGESGGEAEG